MILSDVTPRQLGAIQVMEVGLRRRGLGCIGLRSILLRGESPDGQKFEVSGFFNYFAGEVLCSRLFTGRVDLGNGNSATAMVSLEVGFDRWEDEFSFPL